MSESSQAHLPLICSAEDGPAKTSPWLEGVRAWLESGPDSSSRSYASLVTSLPVGFSLKTSLGFCRATKGEIWAPCSGRWENSGIGGPTGCLTLSFSESPSDVVASSLSQALEPDAPEKYSLSPRACRGILRRAAQRGRKLPLSLQVALEAEAGALGPTKQQEDRSLPAP